MEGNKEICKAIVDYLGTRMNQEDILDQIVLGIFDKMFENLQRSIIQNLNYLKMQGILIEKRNGKKNITYRLTSDKLLIQKILKE